MNAKQKHILKTLITANGLRYSQLGKGFSIDDKYPYHLKYLLTQGYINKRDKKYFITKSGVKATTEFDRRTLKDINPPSLLLSLICQYQNRFYLKNHFAADPTRQPFLCIPTGRPYIGMSLEESCFREAQRKYRIEASFKYVSTFHLTHYATDNDILFDTVHLAFHAHLTEADFLRNQSPSPQLIPTPVRTFPAPSFLEEKFVSSHKDDWYTKDEIGKFPTISLLVQRLILEDRQAYVQDNFTYNYAFTNIDLD